MDDKSRAHGQDRNRINVNQDYEVRDWARSNGYDVPDRGRIPADVRAAFDAAN